jgi:hypothetical protein
VRILLIACLLAGACEGPVLELPAKQGGRASGPVWIDRSSKQQPARSFVVERTGDLLPGAEARGRIGDFRLDNGKVVFLIDNPANALGFAESGGNVIDAAMVGGEDTLGQLFGCLEDAFPRQPIYETVEPGKRGDAAVVVAKGHDSGDPSLEIETEYLLRPGANALEITTTVSNTGRGTHIAYRVGDAIEWGRAERFVPGDGNRPQGTFEVKAGWLLALGERSSYAYVADPDQAPSLPGTHGSAWSDLVAGKIDLPPGRASRVRRWLVVGGTAASDVAETAMALRKQPLVKLRGRVTQEATGVPVPGVRLYLEDSTGHAAALVRAGEDGAYMIPAPAGDYTLRAEATGRRGPNRLGVTLRGDQTTLDVVLSRPGALTFEIRSSGAPSPGRVTFLPGMPEEAPPRLGPSYGTDFAAGNLIYAPDGTGRLEVPPGRYRLVASRGPAYTVDVKDVEVPPGKGQAPHFTFQLERAVDTKGLLCVDLHAHASPSADSAVSIRDRAASVLGEGLDAVVASDHDAIGDWKPAIDALKPAQPLPVILGEEATRDGLGHFTAFPVAYKPDEPRGGAIDPRGRDAHEIVQALRQVGKVVIVNHPRAGTLGWFNVVKLDPRAEILPPGWEGGYDAIELLAGKDVATIEAPLRDWFWLLDHGLTYTAVGGSDAHSLLDQEIGYPRTCVPRASENAADALVSGILTKRDALVTNGPFVHVSVGGRGMGQIAPATKDKARLDVEVQAAPWVDVRRLEVFVNGERRGKPIELLPSHDRLRYRGSIDLKVTEDSWVVVLARGDVPLLPVVSQRPGAAPPLPVAITNPIYLDHNLDGKYTAPKNLTKKR